MARSLRTASIMQAKHQTIFDNYTATFPKELAQEWKAHILKWNKDHTIKPDPYEEIETRIQPSSILTTFFWLSDSTDTSMKEIRLKLALEESNNIGSHTETSHEVTPSAFLLLGLDLEEQQ